MFSYYGSKSKIVKKYPKPIKNLIIEPFAGSARYSLEYFEKDVILVEKYEVVYRIWKYLQQATPQDILNLPNATNQIELATINNFDQLLQEEKWLMGFCCNRGSKTPKNFAGKFNSWDKDKIRISENLYKIRHWKIYLDSYENIENQDATWYIDPPYQKMGYLYEHNHMNYEYLANWCKTRIGQVIVCENDGANWLPFKNLTELQGQRKKSKEVIWYKITK